MNPINEDGETLEPGEPNEPLRDESLRKALAQAPDRSQLPDWRVRQAIIEHAHDATSASEDLLAASRQGAPWWSLAWWREKVGFSGATPWNAALATVLVGVLVTFLWQRAPVPGARLDERPASPAPAAKDESPRQDAQRAAPAAPAASGADSKSAETAAASPKPSPVPAPAPLVPPPPAPAPAAPQERPSAAAPSTPSRTQTQPFGPSDSPVAREPSADASSARRPAAPPPAASEASQERRRSEPAAASAPSAAAPEGKRGAAARQEVAPAAPAARNESPPPMPDFASLSRWTEMRVANVNGEVRVVPRSEAGELSLLMSSAAIMSTGGPPMRSLPEWRVSLERKGQVLAVLEVARNQVRWTEGNLPSTTGSPPVESLDALRTELRQAMKAGSPARAEPVAPPVRAPRAAPPPARPEAAPRPAPVLVDPPLVPPPVAAPPETPPAVQQ